MRMRIPTRIPTLVCCALFYFSSPSSDLRANSDSDFAAVIDFPVESFPQSISDTCREGHARVYDECGSQLHIIELAQAEAISTDKSVLIVYGAEWCVWCHVFDDFIKGVYQPEYFEWARDEDEGKWVMQARDNAGVKDQALALNEFVSENFVIAHIEGDHAPDGPSALNSVGVDESDVKFYPFIMSLTPNGQYADHMLAYLAMPKNETRKDSEGHSFKAFNRNILLEQLKLLRTAAR